MTWFFVGILGPLCWAIGNFIDKLLVNCIGNREHTIGVLTIYSALFSFLVLLLLVSFAPLTFTLEIENFVLIGAGILELGAIILYLIALKEEETSIVVPLFQIIPLFTFLIGVSFLGESLTSTQILAGLAIIIAGAVLSMEFNEDRPNRLKYRVFILMTLSSLLYAVYYALFKYAAVTIGFWNGVFWQHIGVGVMGLLIFFICKPYRINFIENLRTEGPTIFSLNLLNEGIYALGIVAFNFALLLAPIALVGTVYAYQPVFVFVLGTALTMIAPHFIKEKISTAHLLHKMLCIGIIVIASIFLAL